MRGCDYIGVDDEDSKTPEIEGIKNPIKTTEMKTPEKLRLIRWVDDNCPPINLSYEVSHVLHLVKEVKKLRREKEETLKDERTRIIETVKEDISQIEEDLNDPNLKGFKAYNKDCIRLRKFAISIIENT